MASLVISAAVNIGVGLLLNFLYPPRGQDQVGPRLENLTVTSSAYGRVIKRGFGTIRIGAELIWATDKEEVSNTEEVGGKGGASNSVTTFSYFGNFAMLFGKGPAQDVLRIWGNSKLVFDKTGTGLATGKGLKYRFYPGNETQLPDPLIESDKGAGNVSAHRPNAYLVAERWPLNDFGNAIPQITAEITFNAQEIMPFTKLIELAGFNPPGSSTGADAQSHFFIDPFTDRFYTFKSGSGGVSLNSVASMSQLALNSGGLSGSQRGSCFALNKKAYTQRGGSNYEPFREMDGNTLIDTGFTLGVDAIGGSGPFHFRNGNTYFGVLSVGAPELGVEPVEVYVANRGGAFGVDYPSIIHRDETGTLVGEEFSDLFPSGSGQQPVMMDHHNNRLFFTLEDNSEVRLYEVRATLNVGVLGPYVSQPEVTVVGTYTKGGVHYAGTGRTTGYCFVPDEEALVVSNGSSMFKVDINDGSVLAVNLTLGFRSVHQWSTSGFFAFGNGTSSQSGGFINIIDLDDLSLVTTQDLSLAGFADGNENNYPRSAYDPRSHSLIFSRIHGDSPSNGERIVRILLERANGEGEDLAIIVASLCEEAGLEPDEYDVTDLSGITVSGYAISEDGTLRSWLEPLQRAYLFEGVESDWKIKFIRRGKNPVLTVEEDYLGRLSTDAHQEIISEVRQQEVELPEVFEVLYIDRAKDHQQGRAYDKRVSLPTPSQHARNAVSLNLPIVMQVQEAKQLAQRWLYTSWAERLSLRSSLPWRYIRLDPADVFNLDFRGETRRLRMSEIDVGANFELEFNATQEDARSNDSDVPADGGQGLIPQVIPSGLPTKTHLLDLPLLTTEDASFQQFSRGYWAASGYDDTWPGALLYRSLDAGENYGNIGFVNLESAWGLTVGVVPDPETTFTWDESAEIDIKVVRGIDRFQTASDLQVLNGSNAIAVIKSNGDPEIIQFVTATQIDASTVRLSRLLRGRRGTEPLSTNHGSSETIVLLEPSRVQPLRVDLSRLGTVLPYRGVTINTLLEDAPILNFAYAGQDLIPYSPVDVRGQLTSPASTVVDFSWVRRTRFNGELRDGTGEVPLNEQSESYEIDLREVVDGAIFTTLTANSTSKLYDMTDDFTGTGDPFWNETFLLLGFDGEPDGSVNIVDESDFSTSVTVSGDAQIDTDVFKYGDGSLLLDGSGDFIFIPNSSQSTVSNANDKTFECFVRCTDAGFSHINAIFDKRDGSGAEEFSFRIVDVSGVLSFITWNGTPSTNITGTTSLSLDTWHHVAVTRESGVWRMFLDGNLEGQQTQPQTPSSNGAAFKIGIDGFNSSRIFEGNIDEVRLTDGVARYTSNFTPPQQKFPRELGFPFPSILVAEVFQMSGVVGRGRGSGQTVINL